jgi:hypothetical protein
MVVLLAALLSFPSAFGREIPLTKTEYKRLIEYSENPLIVACMKEYNFDFFSNELGGLSIEKQSDDGRLIQLRRFIKSGELTPKPHAKISKFLAQHCRSVARTVVEVMAIRMISQEDDGPSDEKPASRDL